MEVDLSLVDTEDLLRELYNRHDQGIVILEKVGAENVVGVSRGFRDPKELISMAAIFQHQVIPSFLSDVRTMRDDFGDDDLNKRKDV